MRAAAVALIVYLAALLHGAYTVPADAFEYYVAEPNGFHYVGSSAEVAELDEAVQSVHVRAGNVTETLTALREHKKLRHLSLKGLSLGIADFEALAALTDLEYLSLHATKGVTDDCVAKLVTLTKLKTLNLSALNDLTDASCEYLKSLEKLETLHFAFAEGVTDQGYAAMATYPCLTGLCVSFAKVSKNGLQSIASIPRLKFLDVAYCRLDSAELANGLTAAKKLQLLRASDVGSAGLLTTVANLPDFMALDVSGSDLSDADLKPLSTCSNLEWLDVSHNHELTDAAVKPLEKLSAVKFLRIGWSKLTDSGLSSLTGLPLVELDLEGCESLTNDSIAHLLTIKTLLALNLSWINTIDGVEARKLTGLNLLEKLGLNYCRKISPADVQHIKEARKGLEVCDTGIK